MEEFKIIEPTEDLPVEVYAELSKNQYKLIQNGGASIEVPYGVSMKNKAGSRALRFSCVNKEVSDILKEGLDNSGINWQESL